MTFQAPIQRTALRPSVLAGMVFLCFLGLFTGTLFADEALDKEDAAEVTDLPPLKISQYLDPVEIRRTSPAQKLVYDQGTVSKFDDNTIGQALRRLPGVSFESPSEEKDLRIRGLDKEYAQFLVDGQRIPGGGEKREFQLDRLPANLIEKIEIIRNGSARYDSQGIAGTVNVVMKAAPDKRVAQFGAGGGYIKDGNPLHDFEMTYGDRVGNLRYLFNGTIQGRTTIKDNDRTILGARGTVDKLERDDDISDIRQYNFSPGLAYDISGQTRFEFQPFVLHSEEIKDKVKNTLKANLSLDKSEPEHEFKTQTSYRIKTRFLHQFNSNLKGEVGVSPSGFQEIRDKVRRELNSNGILRTTDLEHEDKIQRDLFAWLYGEYRFLQSHLFHIGFETMSTDRDKDNAKTSNGVLASDAKGAYNIEEKRFNFYLDDEFYWGNHTVLTPGFRLEHLRQTLTASGKSSQETVFDNLNPSFHVLHHLTDKVNLRFSIAKTLRRPKYDDLIPFVDSKSGTFTNPDNVGNPSLRPETATGLDGGMEYFFSDKGGFLGVNVFYRDIADKIESKTAFNSARGRYESTFVNLNKGTVYGVELEVNRNLADISLPQLTLTGNLTFTDSSVTDPTTLKTGRFKQQPAMLFNGGFDYAIPDWRMNFGTNNNFTVGATDFTGETSGDMQFLDL